MVHLRKQLLAPLRHTAADGGNDGVPRQEVAGGHVFELTAPSLHRLQRLGQVGVVFETVVHDDLPAVIPQRLDLKALVQPDPRHLVIAHGDEQVVLMQHFVVFKIVQQRIRHNSRFCGQKHRCTVDATRRADEHRVQKLRQPQCISAQLFIEDAPTIFPGHHQRENGPTNQQREPAAVQKFQQVRAPKRQIHHEEKAGRCKAKPQRVFPGVTNHIEGENGGDQHVSCHRNAVRGCQIARCPEHHHRQHNRNKQPPVHKRNVDLPGVAHAGVQNVQARQVAQLNHLLGDAEGPGNQGLRGNHCCHGGQDDQRYQGPIWRHHVKRIFNRSRILQQQRALAEVIQGERRHDDAEPSQANRLFAEMSQVGIQRLGPSHAKHNRAEHDEGRAGVAPYEAHGVPRVEGF